jgi:hypothetical protein
MRYLGIALAISFGMGIALFLIAHAIFPDVQIAAAIAAVPITACHHIAEMLERRQTRESITSHHAAAIRSLSGFTIAWPLLVAHTTVFLIGIGLLATVFGALLIGFLFGAEADFTLTQGIGAIVAAAPIALFGGFVVGRRIGSRCARPSGWTVLLVAAVASLVLNGLGATAVWLGADTAPPVFGSTPLHDLVIETAATFTTFAVAGLLGHRQGRKRRIAEYMDYLLGVLPPDTRNLLVELAYEEAQKVAAAPPAARLGPHSTLAQARA